MTSLSPHARRPEVADRGECCPRSAIRYLASGIAGVEARGGNEAAATGLRMGLRASRRRDYYLSL